MNRWYFFGILLGWVCPVLAQPGRGFSTMQRDSEMIALQKQILVVRHDTARIALLEKLAGVYLDKNNPDSAFYLLLKGLRLANQSHQALNLGRMYRGFGNYYQYRKFPLQRIEAYKNAIRFFQKAQKVPETARAMYSLALSYSNSSEYGKVIEQCTKILTYAKQTNYHTMASSAYALQYATYMVFGDEKSAFATLMALEDLAKQYPTTRNMALASGNLAEWYDSHHQYKEALAYWQMTLEVDKQRQIPIAVVEGYTSIAIDLIKLNEFSQAEAILNKGFHEIRQYHPVSSNIYRTLALLREHQHRLPEAHEALLIAIDNARKTNQRDLTKLGLEALTRIQRKQGKYQQVLTTFSLLMALNDSLTEVNKIQALATAESRIDFNKKNYELTLLRKNTIIRNLEREQIRQRRLMYAETTILVVLLPFPISWLIEYAAPN